jgi:hypothetical protein
MPCGIQRRRIVTRKSTGAARRPPSQGSLRGTAAGSCTPVPRQQCATCERRNTLLCSVVDRGDPGGYPSRLVLTFGRMRPQHNCLLDFEHFPPLPKLTELHLEQVRAAAAPCDRSLSQLVGVHDSVRACAAGHRGDGRWDTDHCGSRISQQCTRWPKCDRRLACAELHRLLQGLSAAAALGQASPRSPPPGHGTRITHFRPPARPPARPIAAAGAHTHGTPNRSHPLPPPPLPDRQTRALRNSRRRCALMRRARLHTIAIAFAQRTTRSRRTRGSA